MYTWGELYGTPDMTAAPAFPLKLPRELLEAGGTELHSSRTSGVKRLIMNGTTGEPSLAGSFIAALNDTSILTAHGGYLFKARFRGERLALGVTPYVLEGKRTYHYDTVLPKEDSFTLIGSVVPAGTFEILFKPASRELSGTDRRTYADAFVRLARFLLEGGFRGPGALGDITVQILRESALFATHPSSLSELAELNCSLDGVEDQEP